jgi:pyrimidine-nucleoside phosphorylase
VGKKIAVGVRNAAIDIRVARYGNFGSTWGEAEENALLLIEVGKQHGLRVVPVLSDMNVPYQPFIGRAESLLAIREVFNVTQLSQLRGHAELCKDLALLAAPDSIRDAVAGVSIQKAREVLGANIEAQMGKVEGFERVCDVTSSAHKHEVHALNSGFMTSDMASLRQHMVEWQHAAKTVNGQRYPDPMGVIMLKRPGEWVGRGETVATFRAPGASVDVVRDALTQVIGIPSNKYRNVGIESIHG